MKQNKKQETELKEIPFTAEPRINKPKNIHQRMLAIMKDVHYLQKEDKAAKGLPYKFISHDKVTGSLHNPMIEHGVMSTTDVLECTQAGNRTLIKAKVSFINVNDPKDRIEVNSYGYGVDPQDKGIGKAVSYATKYAYLKNFMLKTGDDPEKDNINATISNDQIKKLGELIDGDKTLWNFIKKRFKIEVPKDIAVDIYENVITAVTLAKMNGKEANNDVL